MSNQFRNVPICWERTPLRVWRSERSEWSQTRSGKGDSGVPVHPGCVAVTTE